MEKKFTHLSDGDPKMVNVDQKKISLRIATARSVVKFPQEVWEALEAKGFETAKGALLHTANLAGVMAAKRTGDLIPLCHPLPLEGCTIRFEQHAPELHIICEARITAKTGVEMEALTGASVAALTVYDMCKALSHDILISETCLLSKTGGKNDFHREAR
jgi:cyclic pyranopterin phosphate synthase